MKYMLQLVVNGLHEFSQTDVNIRANRIGSDDHGDGLVVDTRSARDLFRYHEQEARCYYSERT